MEPLASKANICPFLVIKSFHKKWSLLVDINSTYRQYNLSISTAKKIDDTNVVLKTN